MMPPEKTQDQIPSIERTRTPVHPNALAPPAAPAAMVADPPHPGAYGETVALTTETPYTGRSARPRPTPMAPAGGRIGARHAR
jgi:hypothetical protein